MLHVGSVCICSTVQDRREHVYVYSRSKRKVNTFICGCFVGQASCSFSLLTMNTWQVFSPVLTRLDTEAGWKKHWLPYIMSGFFPKLQGLEAPIIILTGDFLVVPERLTFLLPFRFVGLRSCFQVPSLLTRQGSIWLEAHSVMILSPATICHFHCMRFRHWKSLSEACKHLKQKLHKITCCGSANTWCSEHSSVFTILFFLFTLLKF